MNLKFLSDIFSQNDISNPTGFSGEPMFPKKNRLNQLIPPSNGYDTSAGYGNSEEGDTRDAVTTATPDKLLALSSQAGQDYSTPILDQYKKYILNNAPNPDDFKPSKTRRILAALAGAGAGASPVGIADGQVVGFRFNPKAQQEASSDILDAPYNKAMKRYSTQANILGTGAEIEERQISNKRANARSEELAKSREEQNRIREENAQTAAKKERDIYETKQKDLQDKVERATNVLEEKKREADLKQGNFQSTLDMHKAAMDLQDARHKLDIAQKDRALDEAKRQHDNEKANWDRQREETDKRLKIMEDAAKLKTGSETDTTTTTEKEGGPSIFGYHPFGTPVKKTIQTKKPIEGQTAGAEQKPPEGAKPGGKWITLPSGKKVYQEP